MRAPTPVRALVHSRTLVIRGLVLMYVFFFSIQSIFLLVLIALLSLVMSGVASLFEEDYKKIVALRTLSQISFCMFFFFFFSFAVYLHLISHAFIKSLLFILLGISIYSLMGQQDCRVVSPRFLSVLHFYMFFICLVALCGVLFTSRVISKEVLLNYFRILPFSFLLFVLFYFGVYITFMYSFRLWFSSNVVFGSWSRLLSVRQANYYLIPSFISILCLSQVLITN